MKIRVTMSIEVPIVPNFLRMEDGDSVPLCAVTDEALRELAAAWTEALIARAHEQHRANYGTERTKESPRV